MGLSARSLEMCFAAEHRILGQVSDSVWGTFTETTRKDQWESYDLICSSKAATLGQEETDFGGSAAQDSASQGTRTGACPSLQTLDLFRDRCQAQKLLGKDKGAFAYVRDRVSLCRPG